MESRRESFVFYRSFAEAISLLPDKAQRADLYDAIVRYALDGTAPSLDGIALAIFTLAKPQLDANNRKRFNGIKGASHGIKGAEYGVKGGRPKTPQKPPKNPPMGGYAKPPKNPPNVNVNDNVNANVNVNVNDNAPYQESTLMQGAETAVKPAVNGVCKKPSVESVLQMARESGAKCHSAEDAELYISSRERTGWKVNGNPVVNIRADIKAFFISKESNERQRADRQFDAKHPSQDFSRGFL